MARKRAETELVEERITLSSPDGEGRAGAEGPELVAGLDNVRECGEIVSKLTMNMSVYLR